MAAQFFVNMLPRYCRQSATICAVSQDLRRGCRILRHMGSGRIASQKAGRGRDGQRGVRPRRHRTSSGRRLPTGRSSTGSSRPSWSRSWQAARNCPRRRSAKPSIAAARKSAACWSCWRSAASSRFIPTAEPSSPNRARTRLATCSKRGGPSSARSSSPRRAASTRTNCRSFAPMPAPAAAPRRSATGASRYGSPGKFHLRLAEVAGNAVLTRFLEDLVTRTSLIIGLYGSHERPLLLRSPSTTRWSTRSPAATDTAAAGGHGASPQTHRKRARHSRFRARASRRPPPVRALKSAPRRCDTDTVSLR